VGDDAAQIFFEMWYTSADSRIRATAKDVALEMMQVWSRRHVTLTLTLTLTLTFMMQVFIQRKRRGRNGLQRGEEGS